MSLSAIRDIYGQFCCTSDTKTDLIVSSSPTTVYPTKGVDSNKMPFSASISFISSKSLRTVFLEMPVNVCMLATETFSGLRRIISAMYLLLISGSK